MKEQASLPSIVAYLKRKYRYFFEKMKQDKQKNLGCIVFDKQIMTFSERTFDYCVWEFKTLQFLRAIFSSIKSNWQDLSYDDIIFSSKYDKTKFLFCVVSF